MIFASDNWAGASERVMAALAEAARRGGPAYGDDLAHQAGRPAFLPRFSSARSRSSSSRPAPRPMRWRSPPMRAGRRRLLPPRSARPRRRAGIGRAFRRRLRPIGLDGEARQDRPGHARRAIARFPEGNTHNGRPVAVSLTELTELGAAYRPTRSPRIAEIAKRRGLAVHMDGARFAGAVAGLGLLRPT